MNENRLDELKREYDSIPVPEELEFRVRASMEQAKKQAQPAGAARTRRRRPFWKSAGLTAAAAMLTLVVLVNSSSTVAYAMGKVPVLGAITRVFTFVTYEDDQGNTSAHVDVPRVEGGSDELNAAIEEYTNAIIEQYKADAGLVKEYEADPDAPDAETNQYHLDLTYSVVTDSDSIFALRFDQTQIMASGNESMKIYNMDKATGKILALGDLFQPGSDYLDVLTKNIQEQMRQQMAADENVYYWLNDEVSKWNFTQLSPDATFYINEDQELVIVFNEGDVAPMAMGVCEFVIPAEAIADIALPGYFA